jgi:hypothetical protein
VASMPSGWKAIAGGVAACTCSAIGMSGYFASPGRIADDLTPTTSYQEPKELNLN